jgi:hypothetical protein
MQIRSVGIDLGKTTFHLVGLTTPNVINCTPRINRPRIFKHLRGSHQSRGGKGT